MALPDYYSVLGVERDARPAQLKKAQTERERERGVVLKDGPLQETLLVTGVFAWRVLKDARSYFAPSSILLLVVVHVLLLVAMHLS